MHVKVLCIPAFIFWIILKIARINFYTYLHSKYPKEFTYPGFGGLYLVEIFKRRKLRDKRYLRLLKLNRALFIITLTMIIITAYGAYLMIK